MKIVTAAALLLAATAMSSMPVIAGTCSTGCKIETKKPVAGKPGQTAYTLVCIDDGSGDQLRVSITAANDKSAQEQAVKKC